MQQQAVLTDRITGGKRLLVTVIGVILSAAILCLSACHSRTDGWNILLYMAADNNLESYALEEIEQLRSAEMAPGVNLFLLLDRSPLFAAGGLETGEKDWQTVRLYRRQGGLFVRLGRGDSEYNSADTRLLAWFLETIDNDFPADKTALVIWGHGEGSKGFALDNYPSGGDNGGYMRLSDLPALWRRLNSKKLLPDMLLFDSCAMFAIELLYETLPFIDYVGGYRKQIAPQGAADYRRLLAFAAQNPAPAELAEYLAINWSTQSQPFLLAQKAEFARFALSAASFFSAIAADNKRQSVLSLLEPQETGTPMLYSFRRLIAALTDGASQKQRQLAEQLLIDFSALLIADDAGDANIALPNPAVPADLAFFTDEYSRQSFFKSVNWPILQKTTQTISIDTTIP